MKSFTFLLNRKFFQIISIILCLSIFTGCSDEDEGTSTPSAPTVVYAWVSTTTTNGNIGGVAAANTICQTDSSGITFNTAVSTHRAILGDSTNDPRTLVNANLPLQKPDGTVLLSNFSDFFDPTIDLSNLIDANSTWYWTGMDIVATNIIPSSNHCNNWTTVGTLEGGWGVSDEANQWRLDDGQQFCNVSLNLLCISF